MSTASLYARFTLVGLTTLLGACRDALTPEYIDETLRFTVVAGDSQTAVVGQPLPDSVVISLVDQSGAAVPNMPLVWRVVSGGGAVGESNGITDSAGRAAAFWKLGAGLGAQALEVAATDADGDAVTDSIYAEGIPGGFRIEPLPDRIRVGDVVPLQVGIEDGAGDPIAGADELVDWVIVDPSIATVDAESRLKATKWGVTEIEAHIGGLRDTIEIRVDARIDTIFESRHGFDSREAVTMTFASNGGRLIAVSATPPRNYLVHERTSTGWTHTLEFTLQYPSWHHLYITAGGIAYLTAEREEAHSYQSVALGSWSSPIPHQLYALGGTQAQGYALGRRPGTTPQLYRVGAQIVPEDTIPLPENLCCGQIGYDGRNLYLLSPSGFLHWKGGRWVPTTWPHYVEPTRYSTNPEVYFVNPRRTSPAVYAVAASRIYRIQDGVLSLVSHPLDDLPPFRRLGRVVLDAKERLLIGDTIPPVGPGGTRDMGGGGVWWESESGWKKFTVQAPYFAHGHWRDEDGSIWVGVTKLTKAMCPYGISVPCVWDVSFIHIQTGEM